MDICVDVGNTTFILGIYNSTSLIKKDYFLVKENNHLSNFLTLLKKMDIDLSNINRIMYSSVVPSVDKEVLSFLKDNFKGKIYRVKENKLDLNLGKIDVNEVGDDLLAALIGAKKKYSYPVLVADLGTASKVLLIDKNGVFDTCLIIPGLSMSISSLSNKAALLPEIELKTPNSALAHNTVEAMNAGVILGHVEMLSGLVKRIEKEIGYPCKHILTGGSAIYLKDLLKDEFIYDENLCLDGLKVILGE